MQVGKTNYSSTRGQKLVFFKLGMKPEQRKLRVRVCPPVKELAESGRLGVYIKQHFGYTIKINGNDIPKTFKCIEQRKGDTIQQECPECEENRLRKAQLEGKLAKLKADGRTDEEAKEMTKPITQYLRGHNLDKKWNLYAKNEAGVWGYLQLGHKAYESFLAACKHAQTLDIADPVGLEEGLWFEFTRTGEAFNEIVDTCQPLQVAGKTKGSLEMKLDSLTDQDLKAIEALPSLLSLGTTVTYDQIKALVSSGGEETVIKSVFESPHNSATQEVQTRDPVRSVAVPTTTTSAVPTPPRPPAPVAVKAASEMTREQLEAALAALQKPAVVAKAAPSPAITPTIQRKLDLDVDSLLNEMDEQ